MKTISKITLMLGLFISSLSTNSFAQSPLVELQAMETSLTEDIAATQASISTVQAQLTTVAADIITATDEGSEDDATAFTARQNDLNASLATLQATLAQQQADLATVQSKTTATQNELNMLDKNWVLANTSSSTPQDLRILNVPDINNPNSLNIIFGSTGNAAQDEEILRAWLFQYGLIDAE